LTEVIAKFRWMGSRLKNNWPKRPMELLFFGSEKHSPSLWKTIRLGPPRRIENQGRLGKTTADSAAQDGARKKHTPTNEFWK